MKVNYKFNLRIIEFNAPIKIDVSVEASEAGGRWRWGLIMKLQCVIECREVKIVLKLVALWKKLESLRKLYAGFWQK